MLDQSNYPNRLANARILIIGASSGLGYGLACACLEHGSTVIVSSSSPSSVEKTLDRLRTAYPSASSRLTGIPCALGDEATLEANIASLFAAAGKNAKLDHVAYTAGDPLAITPFKDITLEKFKQAGMVRFFAPFLAAKHAVPYLSPGPVASFTITSGGVAEKPIVGWSMIAAYSAGHSGMVKNLALDMKPLRVNVVRPGFVDTEMWKVEGAEKDNLLKSIEEKTLTGRAGKVEDVVRAYLYLMTDWNITGTVIDSNSGSFFA